MQITILEVCDQVNVGLYKQIKPPLVGEHAFPLTGFVYKQVGSRYIWWQRWDKVNCQTGVAFPMCFPGQVSGRDFSEGEVM